MIPVDVMFSREDRKTGAARERAAIERAIELAGCRRDAAELLGMTPIELQRRMERLGLRW